MENERLSSDEIKARNMKSFFTIIMIVVCAVCFVIFISVFTGEKYLIRKYKSTAINYVKEKYGFTPTIISSSSDFYCYSFSDYVCPYDYEFSGVLYNMIHDGKKFEVYVPFEEESDNVFTAKISGKLSDSYQYKEIKKDFLNSVYAIMGVEPYKTDIEFYPDDLETENMFNKKYENNNISEFLKDTSVCLYIDYIDSFDMKKVDVLREKYNISDSEIIEYKSKEDYKMNKKYEYDSSFYFADPLFVNKSVIIYGDDCDYDDEDYYGVNAYDCSDRVVYYDFSTMKNPVPFAVGEISEGAKLSDVHVSKSNDIGNLKVKSKYTVVSPVYTINTTSPFYTSVHVYVDKKDIANYNKKEYYTVLRYEDGKLEDEYDYNFDPIGNYVVFTTYIDEDVSNVQFVVVKEK